MKNTAKLFKLILVACVATVLVGCQVFSKVTQVKFHENVQPLVNPGKGWLIYGADVSSYSQEEWLKLCRTNPFVDITDEVWNIGTLGYVRYHWSDIEPEEGRFNWDIIDNAIRICREKKKQFAFGVMTCNTCVSGQATPQYVFDAGAEIVRVKGHDNIKNRDVIVNTIQFNDPVYHKKMAAFLKELGKRYDGSPDIAFFDIRSYGNTGENNVGGLDNKISQITSDEFKNIHVKMHKDAFKRTKLTTCSSHKLRAFSTKDDPAVWQWCVDQGIGLRWDGYLYGKNDLEMIKLTETALKPAIGRDYGILECWQPYGQEKNYLNYAAWKDAVVKTQSSYCSLANWGANATLFYKEHKPFVDNLNNLLGYHFVVSACTFSRALLKGKPGTVQLKLSNRGAAPILIDATVRLALLNKEGHVLETVPLINANPARWKPGEACAVEENVLFSKHPNAFALAVGIFSKNAAEQPDIRFGNNEVNAAGWLLIDK